MGKRLDTSRFIEDICKKMKQRRMALNYRIDDVKALSGLSEYAVREVESGKCSNMLFIIEYARAIRFDVFKNTPNNFSFEPKNEIEIGKDIVKNKVYNYFKSSSFLENGKTISEISKELKISKIIDDDSDSRYVSRIMTNLLAENKVKNISESTSRFIYVMFDWEGLK